MITQAQMDEALKIILKHTRHARPVTYGFIGDHRERSSDIRGSVHRLDDKELERQYKIIRIISEFESMIPQEKKRDLWDATHEINCEYWDRQRQNRK